MRANNWVLGLTGNTGSGKTTVARLLSQWGGVHVDADKLAHAALEDAQAEVVSVFGPGVLCEGAPYIDRKKLAALVFADAAKRAALEGIIHPRVVAAVRQQIGASLSDTKRCPPDAQGAATFYVIDAVLLVEAGLHALCDAFWLVTAPEDVRHARITQRDALSPAQAAARLANQRCTAPIAALANATILNEGSLAALENTVAARVEEFLCNH